jgi:hypothetical protein
MTVEKTFGLRILLAHRTFIKKEWWLRPTAIDGVGASLVNYSQSYQSLHSRSLWERKPSVLKLYPR